MDCREYKKHLCEYVRGELADDGLRSVMKEHSDSCADCKKLYAAEKLYLEALPALSADPPRSLADAVTAKIEEEKAAPPALKTPRRRFNFGYGTAASLILAGVLLFAVYRSGRLPDAETADSSLYVSEAAEAEEAISPLGSDGAADTAENAAEAPAAAADEASDVTVGTDADAEQAEVYHDQNAVDDTEEQTEAEVEQAAPMIMNSVIVLSEDTSAPTAEAGTDPAPEAAPTDAAEAQESDTLSKADSADGGAAAFKAVGGAGEPQSGGDTAPQENVSDGAERRTGVFSAGSRPAYPNEEAHIEEDEAYVEELPPAVTVDDIRELSHALKNADFTENERTAVALMTASLDAVAAEYGAGEIDAEAAANKYSAEIAEARALYRAMTPDEREAFRTKLVSVLDIRLLAVLYDYYRSE